jgi:secreted trypsin-like serine protease
VHRHPQYNATYQDNDVALLQLERAPGKEFKVGKINLIDSNRDSMLETAGTDLTILGWGKTEEGSLPKNLRYTAIKMVDRAECRKNIIQARAELLDKEIIRDFRVDESAVKNIHDAVVANAGQIVNDTMICAGDPNPPPSAQLVHDTCQGDSGGPLIARAGDKPIQVGIVSWGLLCGLPQVYGVYTRLGNYIEWIKTTIKN